jgi:hypothetical protein
MSNLKKEYLVEKRNILNEMRTKTDGMTLQETRIFLIYLSKINPREKDSTRLVRFTLDDFRAIMELGSHVKIVDMKEVAYRLLKKVVDVPLEDESGKVIGLGAFQLFKRCNIVTNSPTEENYFEMNAHDDALPLMFDFKEKYFTYEIWNALKLKSTMFQISYEKSTIKYRFKYLLSLIGKD